MALIGSTLCLFEVKTSVNEADAIKQLIFHKEQLSNMQTRLLLEERTNFSRIKLFWVTDKYNLIVNIETQEQMAFDHTFLENPLNFLTK